MTITSAQHLAMLLQAVEELDRERDTWLKDWKTRRQNLDTSIWKLRTEIMGGQMELPVEPPKEAA